MSGEQEVQETKKEISAENTAPINAEVAENKVEAVEAPKVVPLKKSLAERLMSVDKDIDDEDVASPIVKIKMGRIAAPEFQNAINKLSAIPTVTLSGETVYNLKRLKKKVTKALELFEESRMDLIRECAARDKQGNEIKTPDGRGNFNYTLKPEMIDVFNKRLKELEDIELEFNKMFYNILPTNHGLTANDLVFLAFIVQGKPAEQASQ